MTKKGDNMHKAEKAANGLFDNLKILLDESCSGLGVLLNNFILNIYYRIGESLSEFEKNTADAGQFKETVRDISVRISEYYGSYFSQGQLLLMKKFYDEYPDESYPVELSWEHYKALLTVEKLRERGFYERGALENNWTAAELNRQIMSGLYAKRDVIFSGKKKSRGQGAAGPGPEIFNDPVLKQFLNMKPETENASSPDEASVPLKLRKFFADPGKGFLFDSKQRRITIGEESFYIDLVFYHRVLRCFVLVDILNEEISSRSMGRMQMFINHFDNNIRYHGERGTAGIIIGLLPEDVQVDITIPQKNNHGSDVNYSEYIPTAGELSTFLGK